MKNQLLRFIYLKLKQKSKTAHEYYLKKTLNVQDNLVQFDLGRTRYII